MISKKVMDKCNNAKVGDRIKINKSCVVEVKSFVKGLNTCEFKCVFSKNRLVCAKIDCSRDIGEVYFEKIKEK